MYKLVQGTQERGFARGYGRTEEGVHEEVSIPLIHGRPVDTKEVPLESDNKFISLGDTRCESFLDGNLFIALE